MFRLSIGLTPGSIALAILACAVPFAGALSAQTDPGGAVIRQGGDDVLAVIGDRTITRHELDARWRASEPVSYYGVRHETHAAMKRILDELIEEELLRDEAARRQETLEQLLAEELPRRTSPVTEGDIRQAYDAARGLPPEMTLERARGMISQYLEAQAPLLAKRRFVEELRRPRHVAIYLEPPRLPIRQSSRNPALGSSGASVDIVEFSDFQCPFCKQAAPTLRRLVEKYEGRVRLVWKDFPLPTHAAAKTAAEAGACAHDQGRFWDFHDLMFANQERLTREDLRSYAADLRLDLGLFEDCLDTAAHRSDVEGDVADGRAYGVPGTPTVFINGRSVSGAIGPDAYEQAILDELRIQSQDRVRF